MRCAMLDRQPILTGPTVTLRPLRADDWDAVFAIASDRELWAGHPAHDRWQEAVYRPYFEAGIASGGALAMLDRETGAIIGSSRFDHARALPGEVEIGWTFIARARWGSGVNREVKRLMLGHALGTVEQVIFNVGENNLRSRRAMEKIGGRLTDRVYEAVMAGAPVRHVVYAIDRNDFANGPLAAA